MMAPSLGFSSPAMQASAVLLPQPEGPSRVRNSPSGDRDVEAVHRHDVAEPLGQPLQGHARHSRSILLPQPLSEPDSMPRTR